MSGDTPRFRPTGVHRSDKWTGREGTGRDECGRGPAGRDECGRGPAGGEGTGRAGPGAAHQDGPPVSVRTVRLGGRQAGSTGVGSDFSTAATAFFAASGVAPATGTVPSCAAMRPATYGAAKDVPLQIANPPR